MKKEEKQSRTGKLHGLANSAALSSVMGGYLDVKLRVFQIQGEEQVPWAYIPEDLLQGNHSERLLIRRSSGI
ncbi:MAG: hypothetical protein ACRC9V_03005 [Aeromonas sp.]